MWQSPKVEMNTLIIIMMIQFRLSSCTTQFDTYTKEQTTPLIQCSLWALLMFVVAVMQPEQQQLLLKLKLQLLLKKKLSSTLLQSQRNRKAFLERFLDIGNDLTADESFG